MRVQPTQTAEEIPVRGEQRLADGYSNHLGDSWGEDDKLHLENPVVAFVRIHLINPVGVCLVRRHLSSPVALPVATDRFVE